MVKDMQMLDLQPQVIKMLQQLDSNCTTVSQVIESEDKAVLKAIQDGIYSYNTHHWPHLQCSKSN